MRTENEQQKSKRVALGEMRRELERQRIDKIRQKAFDLGYRAGYTAGRSSIIPEDERKS